MLTGKQRALLRSQANGLQAVFQVGKGGLEPELCSGVAACLAARELVKLKVLENSPLSAREAAEGLAAATGSEVVQVIGGRFVLYLQRPKDSRYGPLLQAAGRGR